MDRQPYWVNIAVALIGLAGAIGAAYITAGRAFDRQFDNLRGDVVELKAQRDDLSRQLALLRDQLSTMSSTASNLEDRLNAVDKASFPLVIATPHEGNYGSKGLTVFAGVRSYGGRPGILITVYPAPGFPFPPDLGIELTVLQQGAQSYAPAILYAGI